MKRRRKKRKGVFKIVFVTVICTLFIMFIGFFLYQKIMQNQQVKAPTSKRFSVSHTSSGQTIYPTLYVTGSSGETQSNINLLIDSIVTQNNNPAKASLTIIVDTKKDYKLNITGTIEPGNSYPAIAVGMVKGTDDPLTYQYTLKVVMNYLAQHYTIPWCNMLGYSSGGSGVLQYLMNYSNDKTLPKVKKFLSLDGEYNKEIPLQKGESLKNVLQNGPQKKSSEYLYWEKNYSRMDKTINVALLASNYQNSNSTDGSVPWADTFSIYNLLQKNGNPVERYIFTGTNATTVHGHVWNNPQAQAYIEKFFYQ